eukprot:COSAG02_NODE_15250_length_1190_cov_0.884510_2_plen_47_part_01
MALGEGGVVVKASGVVGHEQEKAVQSHSDTGIAAERFASGDSAPPSS